MSTHSYESGPRSRSHHGSSGYSSGSSSGCYSGPKPCKSSSTPGRGKRGHRGCQGNTGATGAGTAGAAGATGATGVGLDLLDFSGVLGVFASPAGVSPGITGVTGIALGQTLYLAPWDHFAAAVAGITLVGTLYQALYGIWNDGLTHTASYPVLTANILTTTAVTLTATLYYTPAPPVGGVLASALIPVSTGVNATVTLPALTTTLTVFDSINNGTSTGSLGVSVPPGYGLFVVVTSSAADATLAGQLNFTFNFA